MSRGYHGPHPRGDNYYQVVSMLKKGFGRKQMSIQLKLSRQRISQLVDMAIGEGYPAPPDNRRKKCDVG